MVDADAGAVLAAGVELAGVTVFIFRASSSGLEAAVAVPTLLAGLGSRLMTGMGALEAVVRGAARRLLRVVVEVEELVEEEAGWEEVETGGDEDFSGSGAGVSKTFWILLIPAFFSSSRSFTVIVYPSSGGGGREMWSSRWLDTSWIFRFLFPPLPAESVEVGTGTLGTGVSLEAAGGLSEAVCSDLTEDAELGDCPSSSLGRLEAPSGV